jgi:hypothetical protein
VRIRSTTGQSASPLPGLHQNHDSTPRPSQRRRGALTLVGTQRFGALLIIVADSTTAITGIKIGGGR